MPHIVVALVSGGKDSCYNMLECVRGGHALAALANLRPPAEADELDSYMYQTVGHDVISQYAEAIGLPLFRRTITRGSVSVGSDYSPDAADEVEDLHELLTDVKAQHPEITAVSVGAILSNYQRVRVENVDQTRLLQDMVASDVSAILVKVASIGMQRQHVGKTIAETFDYLVELNEKYGSNVCGEGGEYETITLDCPLFKKKIVIDEFEIVAHSDNAIAPVFYMKIRKTHLEDKPAVPADSPLLAPMHNELVFGGQDSSSDQGTRAEEITPAELSFREPLIIRNGTTFYISGIAAPQPPPTQISAQAALVTQKLAALLAPHSDLRITQICLFVRDMADFAAVNSEYRRLFALNPPTRVCVESRRLPRGVGVLLDCYGVLTGGGGVQVETMHVQGVSYWAPANIGPYSQAVQVHDHVYIAGQIGLVPQTMAMPTGSVSHEARLSFNNLARVADAINLCVADNAALMICYLTRSEYVAVAEAVLKSQMRKECPTSFVVVSHLPMSARVEWHCFLKRPPPEGSHTALSGFAITVGDSDRAEQVAQDLLARMGKKKIVFLRMFYAGDAHDFGYELERILAARGVQVAITPVPVSSVGGARVLFTGLLCEGTVQPRNKE